MNVKETACNVQFHIGSAAVRSAVIYSAYNNLSAAAVKVFAS